MEKTIKIDGKDVKFKSNAATLRWYRAKFRRDFMRDMSVLAKASEEEEFTIPDLEIFENVSFIMAKQADPEIPNTPEEWLENFSTFAIGEILPGIMELWQDNLQTVNDGKKKKAAVAGKSQRH